MEFIALDFEKANRFSHSICSVGLIVFDDNQVIEEKHILVQPPENKFGAIESSIHGISSDDTKDSPLFIDVWEDLKPYFTDLPIVAHNAFNVEAAYISKTLSYYDLEIPNMDFVCTMQLAKSFFNYVPNYSLAHICRILNIDFDEFQHHNALYDAKKAGEVLMRMQEVFLLDEKFKPIYESPKSKKESIGTIRKNKKIPTEFIDPDLDIQDKSHLFFGKTVVITGVFAHFPKRSQMAEMIFKVGGDNNTSISKRTDFVVVGEKAGPAKLKQIEAFGTKTLNENEFIKLFEK